MRVALWRDPKQVSSPRQQASAIELRQAGFSSLAYRLAHLDLPWPVTVAGISVLFYFV
jgi:hypothetical protein